MAYKRVKKRRIPKYPLGVQGVQEPEKTSFGELFLQGGLGLGSSGSQLGSTVAPLLSSSKMAGPWGAAIGTGVGLTAGAVMAQVERNKAREREELAKRRNEYVSNQNRLYGAEMQPQVALNPELSYVPEEEPYIPEMKKGSRWIQKATASIKKRGTEGVCSGGKFGGSGCPPGSKRYNLAKTFKAMAKKRQKYPHGGEIRPSITPLPSGVAQRQNPVTGEYYYAEPGLQPSIIDPIDILSGGLTGLTRMAGKSAASRTLLPASRFQAHMTPTMTKEATEALQKIVKEGYLAGGAGIGSAKTSSKLASLLAEKTALEASGNITSGFSPAAIRSGSPELIDTFMGQYIPYDKTLSTITAPMKNELGGVQQENVPIEVEKNELVFKKSPSGRYRLMADFKGGNTHEEGGEMYAAQEGDIVFPGSLRSRIMALYKSRNFKALDSERLRLPSTGVMKKQLGDSGIDRSEPDPKGLDRLRRRLDKRELRRQRRLFGRPGTGVLYSMPGYDSGPELEPSSEVAIENANDRPAAPESLRESSLNSEYGHFGDLPYNLTRTAPTLYNIGMGLFSEAQAPDPVYNPYEDQILRELSGAQMVVRPQLKEAAMAERRAATDIAGVAGGNVGGYLANRANLQTMSARERGRILAQKALADKELRSRYLSALGGFGGERAQEQRQLAAQRLQAEATKRQFLQEGLTGGSGIVQYDRREKYMRDVDLLRLAALERMYPQYYGEKGYGKDSWQDVVDYISRLEKGEKKDK